METRKKYVILALCVVAFAGIVFGARQFGKTKKTVEIHNANSVQQEVVIENQEEKIVDQKKEEGIVDKAESNIGEEKIVEPTVPEKVAEKKTIEPEKIAEEKGDIGKIVDKFIPWGFTKASDRKIDTVIIHSSYDALGNDPYSVSGIIAEYKQYNVSAHYLVARDGIVYRLVADQNIAWHAGVAEMPDGRTNVNSFSIGVEMINTQDGKYTDEQYSAVNSLIASLRKKYEIKNILGHNEVAPGRKTDPWGMSWNKVNR